MKPHPDSLLHYQLTWEYLVKKAFTDYSSLSPEQRLWFNVQALIGAVDNGGLISHYYNSGADHNAETMEDLIALGFSDVAGLMVQINGLFPGGEPPRDMDARNAVMESWPDGLHDEWLEEIETKMHERMDALERRLIGYIEEKGLVG